jgi:hypothetical protein
MRLDLTHVSRVEVVDGRGRVLVRRDLDEVAAELQDAGRTLKVFISGDEDVYYASRVTRHGLVRPGQPQAVSEPLSAVWGEAAQLADE